MSFKSRNWESLAETDLAVKVMYTTSPLHLIDKWPSNKSWKDGKLETTYTTVQVPTVMVSVMDATTGKIFVGVSRCSPKDQYEAKLGREIACGRALALWKKFNKRTPATQPQAKVVIEETGVKLKVVAGSEFDLALFLKVPEQQE